MQATNASNQMVNIQRLTELLFSFVEGGESLYAILDSARSLEIAPALKNLPVEHVSLYQGRSEEPLWDVAPYLVRCERGTPFMQWLLEKGWGNSWGIFFISRSKVEDLLKHFQQLLLVRLPDKREFYFRFYDPRVLRSFLPTCDASEAQQIIAPVRSFILEGVSSNSLVKFVSVQQGLISEILDLSSKEPLETRDELRNP